MRAHLAAVLLAAGTGIGAPGAQPASADCLLNADFAGATCDHNSSCAINLGDCYDGGACTVNNGDCTNGDTSLLCSNTLCDNQPASSEGYTGSGCSVHFFDGLSGPGRGAALVLGGPFTVLVSDPTRDVVYDVTIRCAVYDDVWVSKTTPGSTGVLAEWVPFDAVPGTVTRMCWEISWHSTKGHTVIYSDVDNDPSNGLQCSEYTYTGG